VEENIIPRRVDVTGGPFKDQAQGPLYQAGSVTLVVPEGLEAKVIESQPGS